MALERRWKRFHVVRHGLTLFPSPLTASVRASELVRPDGAASIERKYPENKDSSSSLTFLTSGIGAAMRIVRGVVRGGERCNKLKAFSSRILFR